MFLYLYDIDKFYLEFRYFHSNYLFILNNINNNFVMLFIKENKLKLNKNNLEKRVNVYFLYEDIKLYIYIYKT